MSYEGSCHCGAVRFTVEGEIPAGAISCNCSHCRRKGFLLTFVPKADFSLNSGEDALTEYRFASHKIAHRFCATCGTQAFGMGTGPDGVETVAVNLRCVPECDLDSLVIKKHDGASY